MILTGALINGAAIVAGGVLGTFGGVIVELGVFDIDVPDTGLP